MGLIMAAIAVKATAAAVSTGFAWDANQKAKAEALHGAKMQGISNEINKYQMFANAAIQQQEMQDQFIADEATAAAVASGQNRRGGSVDAISAKRKNMLDKNIKRMDENAAMTADMLALDSAAATRAAKAGNKAKDAQLIGNTIGTAAKLFG